MGKKSGYLMLRTSNNKKEAAMKKFLGIGLMVLVVCLTLTALAYGDGSLGVNVTNPQVPIDVSSNGVMKSQLHFSKSGNDVGGWIVSVLDNNFFLSSGIKYDATLGGWVQKSSDGQSVIVGTQTTNGYQVFLQSGCTAGQLCPIVERLRINYNGYVGIGTKTPTNPLQMASGAKCTAGGVWTNASSREYKENIKELSTKDALLAFNKLDPVTFTYKAAKNEKHVGFIAEDVPELVATQDRKGLSAMDIVAVLTKVVQEQQKTIAELQEKVKKFEQQMK